MMMNAKTSSPSGVRTAVLRDGVDVQMERWGRVVEMQLPLLQSLFNRVYDLDYLRINHNNHNNSNNSKSGSGSGNVEIPNRGLVEEGIAGECVDLFVELTMTMTKLTTVLEKINECHVGLLRFNDDSAASVVDAYRKELDLKRRIMDDLPRVMALGSSSAGRDIALLYISAWMMQPFVSIR